MAKRIKIEVTADELHDLIYRLSCANPSPKLKKTIEKLKRARRENCDHVSDNQGLCHFGCGEVVNPDWLAHYTGEA